MERWIGRWGFPAGLFAVAAAIAVAAAAGLSRIGGAAAGSEFISFHAAARLLMERGGGAVYILPLQRSVQAADGATGFLPYLHPPFHALAIGGLGLLPVPAAFTVQIGVSLLAAVAALFVLASVVERRRRVVVLAMGVVFLPLDVAVLNGQSDALVLLALASSYALWTRDRPGAAGAAAALALVKPHLILLLPFLFLSRHAWRALAGFAATAAALVAVTWPAFGLRGWASYLALVAPWAAGRPGSQVTDPTGVSLASVLALLPGGRPLSLAILAGVLLVALIALSWRPHRPRIDLAAAVGLSLVLAPYSNFHDLALLLVPGLALVQRLDARSARWPVAGWGVLGAAYLGVESAAVLGPAPAALAAALLAIHLAAERVAVRPDPLRLGESTLPPGSRARRVVVLPAYRAERTLRQVVARIPRDEVDRILLVDDASSDRTAEVALELGIDVIKHPRNLGYGGNQKTCYANALLMRAEVVVMLHPDGQYDPELVPALCREIEEGRGDVALGSRWLGLNPAQAGMPVWKRLGNRFLTWSENHVLGLRLSEYHTGYRAYSRRFLESVPFAENSDNFVFDTQILVQAAAWGFRIAEIPAVGRYFSDASSIGFRVSVVYGLDTLRALTVYAWHRAGLPCRWLRPRIAPEGHGAIQPAR